MQDLTTFKGDDDIDLLSCTVLLELADLSTVHYAISKSSYSRDIIVDKGDVVAYDAINAEIREKWRKCLP